MLLYKLNMTERALFFLTLFLSFNFHFPPLTVEQTTEIVLYSADKYTKSVFNREFGYVD